jgi:hypothetical protein
MLLVFSYTKWRNTKLKVVSQQDVQKIAVNCVKAKKDTDRIDVSMIEENGEVWVVTGTCPIDMEGHPWTERFEVVVDRSGKVRSTYFSLL